MSTASVTRKYRFSASHRLHTPALSPEQNALVFGKCNNPYGHGHDYELEVTVRGAIDERTGLVVNIEKLDSYVRQTVLKRVAHRNLNLDMPEFQALVPTTENLTLVIAELLGNGWEEAFGAGGPKLLRVHIQETGRNSFELTLPQVRETEGNRAGAQALALK